MKILMTTDSVGGVWPYSIELIRQLGAMGCEVVVASFGGALGDAERTEAKRLTNVTLHESDLRLEWMDSPWRDVERSKEWIRSLLRDTRCDLLHFNCFGPAAVRWNVPVLLVAHSCVHSWWRAVHGADPGPEWRRYRECVIGALGYADRVIAPSEASLASLRDCYPEADLGRRAAVIHNGIESRRWPIGGGERSFVFGAGRVWDKAKNLERLAAVAADIGAPVIIAGDNGDVPDALARPAGTRSAARKEEGPHSGAILLGRVSRVRAAEYFRCATVFAHPARYEPFGLAVLEAALSGCPLVLGDIDSLRELWGDVALFVDPDDADALRDALRGLLADPEERRRRGDAARARALHYSARRMASAYVGQYRMLLERSMVAEGAA